MTHHEFRYASHPKDALNYGTEELRNNFLIERPFQDDCINLTYSMFDRFIAGGAKPVSKDLRLETLPYLKSDNFLDRREMGIINVGGKGLISVDGKVFELDKKEALYIGKGAKEVIFKAQGDPMFYINSAPAHKEFPIRKVGKENAEVIQLGDVKYANRRVLNKLIVNSIVETCQLQMGLTELLDGNVWNTMPPHTHERRMEVYFYFDIEAGQSVCHFMGQPQNTRHIFMQNNQAVISPEWSIHAGAGTVNYSFIWGMAGENLDYGDMDVVTPDKLK
ncbi:MAG: 5-dehydro-4-deoxy-D-glucuronate isomerase [Flavobacteriaceae bacterium]|nr:5-dehydro-4-deoxy-D-glucuronate isomerase [Flavobacteriaceae bacterium]